MRLGVISDTHGLVKTEALAALAGVDTIIHAGDVGSPRVLPALQRIAPTIAVRGNIDLGDWALSLPAAVTTRLAGVRFHVLHDIAELAADVSRGRAEAVIHGHSHKPSIEWRDGVLYLNPGSAGPRRFRLPIGLALIDIDGGRLHPRQIELG